MNAAIERITPSALPRIFTCTPSAVLPQVRDEESSADASRGTLVHGYLEACHKAGQEEALAMLGDDDERLLCAAVDLDRIPWTETMIAEAAFAYSPLTRTSRWLGTKGGRDYSKAERHEIPGTVDLFDDLPDDDAVFVGDFKVPGRKTKPARDNEQLKMYALMAARALGRSHARIQILHVDPDLGTVWSDHHEMDAFALDAFEEELLALLGRVGEWRAAVEQHLPIHVVRGDHCSYCPAWRSCPATMTLAREVGREDFADVLRFDAGALTTETAPLALQRIRDVEKLVKLVKEELKTYAEREPFATIDGKTYGPTVIKKKSLDAEKALATLVEDFGMEAVVAACPPAITLKQIETIVKADAVAKGQKVAPLQRATLARLEEAGALRIIPTTQIREH